MSFTKFDLLPTELKLSIVNHSDAITLTQLLKTNKQIRELTFYIINNKIASLTGLKNEIPQHHDSTREESNSHALSGLNLLSSTPNLSRMSVVTPIHQQNHKPIHLTTERTNNILISLFSPQNVENNVELYETKCLSNANSNAGSPIYGNSLNSSSDSLLELIDCTKSNELNLINDENLTQIDHILTNLDQTEDIYSTSKFHNNNINENIFSCFELGSLVKTRNPLTKKITPTTTMSKTLPMNLLVDEESNNVRLTIQLSLSNQVTIFDKTEFFKTEWASDDCKFLISQQRKYGLMFKLQKGDEIPPRSPYDYEAITNYYLDIDNFMINNCYLLKCVEDSLN